MMPKPDRRRLTLPAALGLGLLVLLIVSNVVATHSLLTQPHPGHNDFMSRWEGVRSYWRDGLNPYSEHASYNIQVRIYGRLAGEDEDPGYFAYPFYTVLLMWPLAYVSYAWASAIWMVVLETCLISALVLLLDLYDWRPSPWMLGALLLWTLLNYYGARGLILGQPGHIVYFLQVLAIWAIFRKHDWLAGSALAVSTLKPQMGFLLVPFVLIWGWRNGCRPIVISFAVVWGSLMGLSFIAEPAWLSDWIEQLRRYPSYTDIGAPVWIVMQYYLGAGTGGEWVANLALYGLLLWAWYSVLIQQRNERLMWTIVLTLTITHLSAVRTATPHYVIFTIPLVFYGKLLMTSGAFGKLAVVVIFVALLIVPWVHFLATVEGEFEHASVYLPLPFTVLIALWLTRRLWRATGPALDPNPDTPST